MPEVVAFALTRNMPWDQRKNGFCALMVELMEKLNVRFLGRTASPGNSYNIYTNVLVNDPRPDLSSHDQCNEEVGLPAYIVAKTRVHGESQEDMGRGRVAPSDSKSPLVWLFFGQLDRRRYRGS